MASILHQLVRYLARITVLAVPTVTAVVGNSTLALAVECPSVVNGLYYPTSPQLFFEQGRLTVEREIQRLERQPSMTERVLEIDEELKRQLERSRQLHPNTLREPITEFSVKEAQ